MKLLAWFLAIGLTLASTPMTVMAYVGPGAGLGALGALAGLAIGILLAVWIVLSWPIRMLIRRLRKKSSAEPALEQNGDQHTEPNAGAAVAAENE